jgi:cytoskeletal protein RodZ
MKLHEFFKPRERSRKAGDRGWPGYLFGGRMRTSTVALIVALFVLSWVQQKFAPEPADTQPAASQVVPPGFVPDPEYTWVPRTQVQTPTTTRRTTTTTTTTTPTTTTPTTTETTPDTTTSGTPTSPTTTTPSAPTTTVFDPDGPGLLPPQTLTVAPSSPAPLLPGLGPLPTLPAPPP